MIIIPSQPVGRNQRRSSREDDKAGDSLDKMASYEDDVIEEEDSVEDEVRGTVRPSAVGFPRKSMSDPPIYVQ